MLSSGGRPGGRSGKCVCVYLCGVLLELELTVTGAAMPKSPIVEYHIVKMLIVPVLQTLEWLISICSLKVNFTATDGSPKWLYTPV